MIPNIGLRGLLAGEVFISYRRADEAWARLLHAQLHAEGVEAWYDAQIGAGQDWRSATARALQDSRIFVLLFSAAAAQSEDIAKELAAAIFSKKLVVPVRIENIQPSGAFLYELASRNWVNAFDNTEPKLAELARSLARLVKSGNADESITPFDRNVGATTPVRKPGGLIRRPLVIAAAAIVIAAAAVCAGFHAFLRPSAHVAAMAPPANVAGLPALPRPAGNSIAVLPFVNLSGDPKQEFFSDGMTEELTSALAKISGLPVVGRTSAFAFKGKNQDLSAIGQALHANYLLEGSVRRAEDRVRITAQLIKAATGDHVWTESYDRNLTDVFAVQEDVAKAIAAALRTPLGLKQSETLVNNRQIDPVSYENYLRATALIRKRNPGTPLDVPIALLEGVVVRQPNYAPAWARLAEACSYAPLFYPSFEYETAEELRRTANGFLAKAANAARRAIQLDPRNAVAYAALGRVQGYQGNWPASEQSLKQALNLDPLNPDVLHSYSQFFAVTGQVNFAVPLREKLNALDPLVPVFQNATVSIFLSAGQNAKALAFAQALPSGSSGRASALARFYAATKRFKDAAESLAASFSGPPPANAGVALRLLRTAPASAPPENYPFIGSLSFVFLYVGMPERALEPFERNADAGFNSFGPLSNIWQPDYGPARKTERFKRLMRELGMIAYWRARGWPQFCHPVGAEDFACK